MDEAHSMAMYNDVVDIGKDTDDLLVKSDKIMDCLKGMWKTHTKGADMNMDDGLGLAALMNSNNRNDWMNNPFAYIALLFLFGLTGNGNGFLGGNNNGGAGAELYNSLGEIKAALTGNGVQNNQLINEVGRIGQTLGINRDFLTSAINNNREAICSCCCQIQQALCNNAHETAMQIANLSTQMQMGNCHILEAIKDCCCQTNLNMERIANKTERSFCDLNNTMNQQFTGLLFATQQENQKAIDATREGTAAILKHLNDREYKELEIKYEDLRAEQRINNAIATAFNNNPYYNRGFYPGYPGTYFPYGSENNPLFVKAVV